ncbi:MAG: putative lipid II flippase FtsW [Patescibacteria group bacterium]
MRHARSERKKKVDKFFLTVVLLLAGIGIAIFISASLGVLARSKDTFYQVLISQIGLGIGLGIVAMYFTSRINYKFWRKSALFIFIGTLFLTAAVFIPSLGVSHQGAERWISLGPVSFQPAEALKLGFVMYFAAWLASSRGKIEKFRYGVLPLLIMLGIIALILFSQPDTKSFILIAATGLGMLYLAGAPLRHIVAVGALAGVVLATLVFFTPYLKERVKTFLAPGEDVRGSGYQIQQSLIAIGSGGVFGRGYGQSIQKFSYLPEPQGDSIFAVLGEEFGFVGTVALLTLYLFFVLRGFRIANNSPDTFGRLLTSGIVILITMQAMMHIASTTGVFPLTGVPLPFVSQGGTALAINLAAIGIVLQISKARR